VTYREYSDADVGDVDPQLALAGLTLDSPRSLTRWWLGAGAAITVALAVFIIALKRRRFASTHLIV
jgi:hypothetical protein